MGIRGGLSVHLDVRGSRSPRGASYALFLEEIFNMAKETIEIVKELVSEIDRTINIDSVMDNGDGTCTIFSCNTKWIQAKFTVTIDSNPFVVVSIDHNVSITITGACPVVSSFEAYPPFFFNGTVSDTNQQLTGIPREEDKVPMCYLFEPFTETIFRADSALERESSLRLFFLSHAEEEAGWLTPEHYNEVVKPMRSFAQGFIEAVEESSLIDTIEEYSSTSRVKFGVSKNKTTKDIKGYAQNRFNMFLSGVEINITLPIFINCKTDCNG